jgi:hypothetical protein
MPVFHQVALHVSRESDRSAETESSQSKKIQQEFAKTIMDFFRYDPGWSS